ncbi:hypothetical protein Aph01nite_00040 [Acrocarpospora phusangensis]|uniref:Uncharacterized protein n=2 Tax=Acrocarpospora phusangensis TaxID=1070424 RepID=A0A919UH65_9ACTN|nr:hypothetical protein Aph01nite_00040 [Acrocarpospora phusangensis]
MTRSGCDGYCGSCVTPCFLRGSATPADPMTDPEVAYSELADDMDKSDAEALGCTGWDDSPAECPPEACTGNFFCLASYAKPE